jgi:outer membrane beta-barrel protein
MMQRRHTFARASSRLLGVLLLGLCASSVLAPVAMADDVLENTPVMRRSLQYRAGRQELGAIFNATLGDPYTRNFLPGIRYDYHFLEWLSVGADFMYGISSITGASDQIAAKVRISNPNFIMEPSSINYMATAHVQAAPLVGKFVAFGSLPIQFDLHATLSFGIAGLTGGPTIDAVQKNVSIAPGIGGGFRLFFSRIVALNVDLADVYMKRTLAVTRFGQAPPPNFSGNLLFSAGVSVFLPPNLKRAD